MENNQKIKDSVSKAAISIKDREERQQEERSRETAKKIQQLQAQKEAMDKKKKKTSNEKYILEVMDREITTHKMRAQKYKEKYVKLRKELGKIYEGCKDNNSEDDGSDDDDSASPVVVVY